MIIKFEILSQNQQIHGKKYIVHIDKTEITSIGDFINHLNQILQITQYQYVEVYEEQFRLPERETIQLISQNIQYRIKVINNKRNKVTSKTIQSISQNHNIAEKQNQIDSQEYESQSEYKDQLNILKKKSIVKKEVISNNSNAKQIKRIKEKFKYKNQEQWKTQSSDSSNQQIKPKFHQKKQFKNFFINLQKQNQQKPMVSLEEFIGGQVNYYFSDKNYYKDQFLQKACSMDEQNYMSIDLLLTFPKIKKVVTSIEKLIYFLQIFETKNKNYELDQTRTRIRKFKVNNQNI